MEINPEELRIGNYIYSHDIGGTKTIVKLDKDLLIYYLTIDTLKLHKVEPIPLTEEILLKCGFKKMISQKDCFVLCLDEVFSLDSKDLIYNIKNNCVYINSDAHILEPISTIEFVHQLQNLYFALTQEELVFQLKT